MLQMGWTEIGVVVLILLLVLGPKRLPGAIKSLKRMFAKLHELRSTVQRSVDDVVSQAEDKPKTVPEPEQSTEPSAEKGAQSPDQRG